MHGVAATRLTVGTLVFASGLLLASGAAKADDENWARASLNGVLWMQTSAEYRALALGAYAQARSMLDKGLADPGWTAVPAQEPRDEEYVAALGRLPPAVILDLDETVLDNGPFQAWLVERNESFHSLSWNRWVADESARAVPGALPFVVYARRRGVAVFYVTNRAFTGDVDADGDGSIGPGEKDRALQPHTIANLRRLGFLPQQGMSDDEAVLMRGEQPTWGRNKATRRAHIAARHRVLLLIGDSLGDFVGDLYRDLAPAERRQALAKHDHRWGTTWIALPNPLYGGWEAAAYGFDYGLPPGEKGRRKLDTLDAWAE